MNFKDYIKITEQNTVGTHNDFATGAILPSTWTGSESAPEKLLPHLPSTDLAVPSITKSSFITKIEKNKNPIVILCKDMTKLFLSLDQFNRINNKPEVGKRITIVFQRHPADNSESPSKIEKIEIN